jgi:hypothetical protein
MFRAGGGIVPAGAERTGSGSGGGSGLRSNLGLRALPPSLAGIGPQGWRPPCEPSWRPSSALTK